MNAAWYVPTPVSAGWGDFFSFLLLFFFFFSVAGALGGGGGGGGGTNGTDGTGSAGSGCSFFKKMSIPSSQRLVA